MFLGHAGRISESSGRFFKWRVSQCLPKILVHHLLLLSPAYSLPWRHTPPFSFSHSEGSQGNTVNGSDRKLRAKKGQFFKVKKKLYEKIYHNAFIFLLLQGAGANAVMSPHWSAEWHLGTLLSHFPPFSSRKFYRELPKLESFLQYFVSPFQQCQRHFRSYTLPFCLLSVLSSPSGFQNLIHAKNNIHFLHEDVSNYSSPKLQPHPLLHLASHIFVSPTFRSKWYTLPGQAWTMSKTSVILHTTSTGEWNGRCTFFQPLNILHVDCIPSHVPETRDVKLIMRQPLPTRTSESNLGLQSVNRSLK